MVNIGVKVGSIWLRGHWTGFELCGTAVIQA
jgi:hypothetical protein